MLDRMEDNLDSQGRRKVRPDAISYQTVMDAWASSKEIYAAENAEAILERMDTRYREGYRHLKPTLQSYNIVLNSLSKSRGGDAAERAQKILQFLEEQCESGNTDLKPDVVAYTTVMDCLAKSRLRGKATSVKGILDHMHKEHNDGDNNVRPNVYSYGTVLNACAYTYHRDDKAAALEIALDAMEEVKKIPWLKPSHVIYASFFKVIANSMSRRDPRRNNVIQSAFQECCARGLVSPLVLGNLRTTASAEQYAELLGNDVAGLSYVVKDDLPKEWTCNVKQTRSKKVSTFRRLGNRKIRPRTSRPSLR